MMLPDYDMNKFFTLDPEQANQDQNQNQAPPRQISHKHHKS